VVIFLYGRPLAIGYESKTFI